MQGSGNNTRGDSDVYNSYRHRHVGGILRCSSVTMFSCYSVTIQSLYLHTVVWHYALVKIHSILLSHWHDNCQISTFFSLFHNKYTSNMVECSLFNNVTASAPVFNPMRLQHYDLWAIGWNFIGGPSSTLYHRPCMQATWDGWTLNRHPHPNVPICLIYGKLGDP